MGYKFELTEQPAQPVLSMRTRTAVGNLPQEIGKAYHAIIQYLNEIGEKPLNTAFGYGGPGCRDGISCSEVACWKR